MAYTGTYTPTLPINLSAAFALYASVSVTTTVHVVDTPTCYASAGNPNAPGGTESRAYRPYLTG